MSFDINRHRFLMLQILRDIYSQPVLAANLGFKGGTACMFFYGLKRFSVDLDFNLTNPADEDDVYERVRRILLKYGKIHDEAKKFYGPLLVLDYGAGARNLKVEISKRDFGDTYHIADLMGISIKLLDKPNMFAHKLCALLDRTEMTNRDIFDVHHFMDTRTPIKQTIVEQRMSMPLTEYLQECILRLKAMSNNGILNGIGELVDQETKNYVRKSLLNDTIQLLEFYKAFPIAE